MVDCYDLFFSLIVCYDFLVYIFGLLWMKSDVEFSASSCRLVMQEDAQATF